MAYQAEISRANPTAMFFVMDQSYSMNEQQGGAVTSKAENLATVINRILNDLVIRCSKGEEVFDYFEVSLIGYGNDAFESRVGSAFGGVLAGRDIVPVSDIADSPVRVEQRTRHVDDGAGGLVEMKIEFPVWLEPVYSHNTPMMTAMQYTHDLVVDRVRRYPESFPPIVIHVTDGHPSDGDPREIARAIRQLRTTDGNVLIFSLHLSTEDAGAIYFPAQRDQLPDDYARLLFDMSSVLPPAWQEMASNFELPVMAESRAFVFNADLAAMVRFLEIGTRQPTRMR